MLCRYLTFKRRYKESFIKFYSRGNLRLARTNYYYYDDDDDDDYYYYYFIGHYTTLGP